MKELVKEGVVDGVKSLVEVNGEEGGAMMGLLTVKFSLNGLGKREEGSVARVKGVETMLIRILGKGVKEGKDQLFKDFNRRAEKGDGAIGDRVIGRFTGLWDRDDVSGFPKGGKVGFGDSDYTGWPGSGSHGGQGV